MNKIFTYLGTFLLTASALTEADAARVRLTPDPLSEAQKTDIKRTVVTSISNVTPCPLKVKENAAVSREQLVLDESFNLVPDGSTVTTGDLGERYVDFLASHNDGEGRYIPNEYTPESGTWEGDWVFAGQNGTVIIQPFNPVNGGYLATPLGDYSGDLTVKVRCRYANAFWGYDNETGYVSSTGSALNCIAYIGGYDYPQTPVTDMETGFLPSGQIFPNDGWVELTYTFRNEGANKDGFIMFQCNDAIEIDWIRITDAASFLACPVVEPATDFTADGFTINWNPVRRSYNYYIDLWKANYLSDSGINETIDFEDGKIPEGWNAAGNDVVSGLGADGGSAVKFGQNGSGHALETSDFGKKKLGSLTFDAMFEINDENQMDENYAYGKLLIDGLTENGWQPIAEVVCDMYGPAPGYYKNYIADGPYFEDIYSAVRFYTEGFGDTNNVYIDNIVMWGKRPYELERVEGEESAMYDPDNDDYAYNFYTHTEPGTPCSYTFTGLDPESEYWYRVRSHNVSEFTVGKKYHAFGVMSPQLLSATNISNGSYTANWADVPKAQSYLVRNYKIEKIEANETDRTIFSDSFSKCSGENDVFAMSPIGNSSSSDSSLDDYTDMPGWTGVNNSFGNHMLGGDMGARARLTSPNLPVNPNRGSYYLYIEAYGYPEDILYIDFLESGLYANAVFDKDGYVSGMFEVPVVINGERVQFSSYCFGLTAFEISQNVEEGDLLRTYHSEEYVEKGIQKFTFNNLETNGMYAYQVFSRFDLEKETAYSNSSDFMVVDMANGNSFITSGVDIVDSGVFEISRYNLNGIEVGKDYKGIVIIRMSDGSMRKSLVK